MNFTKDQYLFQAGSDDKKLFILNKGAVKVYLKSPSSNKEYPVFTVNEAGSILGIIEVILGSKRLVSIKTADENNDFNVIDLAGKKISDTIQANPKLGLQFGINLAMRLKQTNNLLTEISNTSNAIKTHTNKLCLSYYELCEEINKANEKYKFPWLKSIYETVKMNLIYQYGNAANSGKDVLEEMVEAKKEIITSVEKEDLGNIAAQTFKAGETLCEQGAIGKEMFILLDGELSVYVNNNKVAEITKKSEVIGEIAVLLGLKYKTFEKRTATVKIKKDAKILIIPFDKIFEVINKDPKIIVHITKTLAERTPESYWKLLEIYEKMDKAINLMNPTAATSATCPKAFKQFLDVLNQKANDKEKVASVIQRIEKILEDSKQDYAKYSAMYESLLK